MVALEGDTAHPSITVDQASYRMDKMCPYTWMGIEHMCMYMQI